MCPLSPPPAALQVIGDADGLLGDAKKARDHWQRVNACKATTKPFAPSPCVAYDGCAAERPEVYCEIPGMGHSRVVERRQGHVGASSSRGDLGRGRGRLASCSVG